MQVQHRGAGASGIGDADEDLVVSRSCCRAGNETVKIAETRRQAADADSATIAAEYRVAKRTADEGCRRHIGDVYRRCLWHAVGVEALGRNDLLRLAGTHPVELGACSACVFIIVELDVVSGAADDREAHIALVAHGGPLFERFVDDFEVDVADTIRGMAASVVRQRHGGRLGGGDARYKRCHEEHGARGIAESRGITHGEGGGRIGYDRFVGVDFIRQIASGRIKHHLHAGGERVRRKARSRIIHHRHPIGAVISVGSVSCWEDGGDNDVTVIRHTDGGRPGGL